MLDKFVVKLLTLKMWLSDDHGQDALEYALLGGLIAVAVLVAVAAFGTAMSDWFNSMATKVDTWGP